MWSALRAHRSQTIGEVAAHTGVMSIQIIEQADLGGEFEGYLYGSEITLILEHEDRIGAGPRLHQHPYSETFVLRRGAARFTVGDERFEAVGGQLLVVPAFTRTSSRRSATRRWSRSTSTPMTGSSPSGWSDGSVGEVTAEPVRRRARRRRARPSVCGAGATPGSSASACPTPVDRVQLGAHGVGERRG